MFALDANIFLELLLQQEKHEECRLLLQQIFDGKQSTTISDFTISIIAIALERYKKRSEDIKIFLLSLLRARGLSIHHTSIFDLIAATEIMEKYHLDYEDSVTLQCALANKCTALVSFDADFKNVKELKIMRPKEVII